MNIPVDFGYWRTSNGQRQLLTWHPATGALCLGDRFVLAVIRDEDDLRRRLADWTSHCDLRDGLGWLATQLEGCR